MSIRCPYWATALRLAHLRAVRTGVRQRVVGDDSRGYWTWIVEPAPVVRAEACS